jgi:hypothetical protein
VKAGRRTRGCARAPGLAPCEIDPLRAQKTPDMLVADIAQCLGNQGCGPTRPAGGRRPVEHGHNAPVGRRAISLGLARARRIRQAGEAVFCEANPLLADHAAGRTIRARSNRRCSVVRERTQPSSVVRSPADSHDRRRFLYIAMPRLWHTHLCQED